VGAGVRRPARQCGQPLAGRAIDFHEGDVVDEEALTALIHAAVALNFRTRT
jgi:hypothetical protein